MCDYDGEHPEFESRTWRTARKQHTCCACAETVRPGDRYHITAGRWDGQMETYKHCARCWGVCEALWKEGSSWIDFHLNCGETWESAFEEDPPAEVAALAFALPRDFAAAQVR